MVELFDLPDRVASQTDSKLLEDLTVDFAEHHGRMYLASLKFRKLVKSLAAVLVIVAQKRDRNKHLISMKTRIMSVEILDLCLLDWLDHLLRDQIDLVRNACKMFSGIDDEGSAWTEERAGAGGNDRTVMKLDCGCGDSGEFLSLACCNCGPPILSRQFCLLEDK